MDRIVFFKNCIADKNNVRIIDIKNLKIGDLIVS